jgi:hypothetical protein
MSETTAISDDALKLLVAEHGVRGTARMLQMDESATHAFRKRVTRAGWMTEPAVVAIREKTEYATAGRPALPIVAKMSPTSALQAEIAALGQKTRVSLARGIAKAGETVEAMTGQEIVENASNVKSIGQTADLIHGWKDQTPNVKIRLDVLGASAESPVFDIEASVSPTDVWASEDVDDY